MRLEEFVQVYASAPVIDSSTFSLYDSPEDLRRQVQRWVKKGYLITLKRGLYVFCEQYRKTEADHLFVANLLVSPSYVSLTYALSHYGIIPEKATVVTSVTTKKTRIFENDTGVFEYRSIKQKAFKGYKGIKAGVQNVFIASPEKSLTDYFYYNSERDADAGYFESLRLQNLEILDVGHINSYLGIYNARVDSIITNFIQYLENYKGKFRSL